MFDPPTRHAVLRCGGGAEERGREAEEGGGEGEGGRRKERQGRRESYKRSEANARPPGRTLTARCAGLQQRRMHES